LGTGHTPILYHEVAGVDDGNLSSDYNVLGWGERYHFENSSNDSI